MYHYKTQLRLRDTDAAGVIYFANIFNVAQEALESFMDSVGMDIGLIIRSTRYNLPVVHADADFKRPIFPGHRLQIQLTLEHMGDTSFTLHYIIADANDVEHAQVRVTHVVIDRTTGAKQVPNAELRSILEQLK